MVALMGCFQSFHVRNTCNTSYSGLKHQKWNCTIFRQFTYVCTERSDQQPFTGVIDFEYRVISWVKYAVLWSNDWIRDLEVQVIFPAQDSLY